MYLFQSLARALATNEDTFRIIYKNIPSAIEQGIFKVEYEWDDETMYAKFMIWSPSENMYKIPDDTCKIEDSIIESMIAYHFSTN